MSSPPEEVRPLIHSRPRVWGYRYHAGPVRSKFLVELRDNQRIMGTKCPTCQRVYVPARSTCPRCFRDLEDWVQVADRGTLLDYTVVYQAEPPQPLPPPFAYGIILLDGADTGLVHVLGDVNLKELRIGMRVQAVFAPERKGHILDIKYFRPLPE